MKSRANLKRAVAAVAAGVIIGGGVTIVTPAGAEVSQFAATNWKKIWKKKLQPQADKRYYTKAASNARYVAAGSVYSKAEVEAKLGGYYTKAEADAKYQPVGNYAAAGSSYTKAEADAKYSPTPKLLRGTFFAGGGDASGSQLLSGEGISFNLTFSAAPTPHYIMIGDPVPPGCSGTAAAPDASPGHLCVFETLVQNMSANRGTLNSAGGIGSTPFGAAIFGFTAAAGQGHMLGTWAARPVTVVSPAFAPKGGDSTAPGKGLTK